MIPVDELKKINIPVVPMGVGTTRHEGEDDDFTADSVKLLAQIHSQCHESSARDPRTYEVLRKAGCSNVRMTGCPTLYRSLKPRWTLNRKDSREVVVTVRKRQDSNIKLILQELAKNRYEPVIAAQKKQDLYTARKRFPWLKPGPRSLYEFNIEPYQALVDNAYGSIGWRLHGNMFHLAHGNPAVFFANCSRVKSFCEAFDLPYVYAEDGTRLSRSVLVESVEHLLAADIYEKFPGNYARYYAEMAKFLDNNGIAHKLEAKDS
jgi:polysaccharide pyruvyl transferase WcaK-like protein